MAEDNRLIEDYLEIKGRLSEIDAIINGLQERKALILSAERALISEYEQKISTPAKEEPRNVKEPVKEPERVEAVAPPAKEEEPKAAAAPLSGKRKIGANVWG